MFLKSFQVATDCSKRKLVDEYKSTLEQVSWLYGKACLLLLAVSQELFHAFIGIHAHLAILTYMQHYSMTTVTNVAKQGQKLVGAVKTNGTQLSCDKCSLKHV